MKIHVNPNPVTAIVHIKMDGISIDLSDDKTWAMGLFRYPDGEVIEALGKIEDPLEGVVLLEAPSRGIENGLKVQVYLYHNGAEVYTDICQFNL